MSFANVIFSNPNMISDNIDHIREAQTRNLLINSQTPFFLC